MNWLPIAPGVFVNIVGIFIFVSYYTCEIRMIRLFIREKMPSLWQWWFISRPHLGIIPCYSIPYLKRFLWVYFLAQILALCPLQYKKSGIREFVMQPSKVCSKEVSSASIVEIVFKKNASQLWATFIWLISFWNGNSWATVFKGYWSQELLVFHLLVEGIQERRVEDFQGRSMKTLLGGGWKLQELGVIAITQQVQWHSY